ncbi:MAG: hypothetical protein AAFN16_06370, partial [Pseudomonadota bacterium]
KTNAAYASLPSYPNCQRTIRFRKCGLQGTTGGTSSRTCFQVSAILMSGKINSEERHAAAPLSMEAVIRMARM